MWKSFIEVVKLPDQTEPHMKQSCPCSLLADRAIEANIGKAQPRRADHRFIPEYTQPVQEPAT
jgi:hypothetical protein